VEVFDPASTRDYITASINHLSESEYPLYINSSHKRKSREPAMKTFTQNETAHCVAWARVERDRSTPAVNLVPLSPLPGSVLPLCGDYS
jgi:hypothetical protein